jgi:hypothetical protein
MCYIRYKPIMTGLPSAFLTRYTDFCSGLKKTFSINVYGPCSACSGFLRGRGLAGQEKDACEGHVCQ